MLSKYFLCRVVQTDVQTHVRSVVGKSFKLTKTALGNDTFSGLI